MGDTAEWEPHGKYSFDTFTHRKSCLIRTWDKLGEALGKDRYPPYTETKLRRLIFLLQKRQMPSMRFIPYMASFALGIASVFLIRYIAKVWHNSHLPKILGRKMQH